MLGKMVATYEIFKMSMKCILGMLGAVDADKIISYKYIKESEIQELHDEIDIF